MKKEARELLQRFTPYVETHNDSIKRFLLKLENQAELPKVFEEKLKTIKDNPVEEPIIAQLKEKLEADKSLNTSTRLLDILEAVYTMDELDIICDEHNLDIEDIILMGGAVYDKVFAHESEDEHGNSILKEIESQKDLTPLKFSTKREFIKEYDSYIEKAQKEESLVLKITKLYSEIDKLEDLEDIKSKNTQAEELQKELNDLREKSDILKESINKKALSESNLKTSEMSKWEKDLLIKKIIQNAYGKYTPPVGKK